MTRQDIDWLRFKLDALTPAVFESSLPAQALHGDASMSNLLRTESGLVWNDLEDVCAGPVAWDIAGLVTSARARGQSATFIEELLAAYGDPGVEDLEPFLEAHALYEVVWQAFEGRRRPQAMKRAAASPGALARGARGLSRAGLNELEEDHLGRVRAARAELDDPRVAAGALRVAGRDLLEELVDQELVLAQLRERLAARVQVAALGRA